MTPARKHAAIIGAGLAGLAAAYDLAQRGWRVTILEASPELGGLASSFQFEGQPIERFYHFICRADQHLIQLVNELGLQNQLHWSQTHTAFFHDGHLYSFGTPLDLLFFRPVPWLQRLRFGLHILRSRYRSQWRWLDQLPARPWLIENIGEKAYQVIWHPLLRIKFGEYYDRISAAWVWHRIWRVARSRRRIWERESFGYLENGSATLVEALGDWLRRAHPAVQILTNCPVHRLEIKNERIQAVVTAQEQLACEAVISTLALPQVLRLLPGREDAFVNQLKQVKYIGVICAVLSLKQPFSRNFWMNINDPRLSFNGVIEQTNLNQGLRRRGLHILYIPFYLPTDEARYRLSDEELISEYLPMLRVINPSFSADWVKEWRIFRTPYAQAICTTGFADLMPPVRTPIRGFYLTDSTQFYPEDRTLSAAIRQGRRAAQLICEDFSGAE